MLRNLRGRPGITGRTALFSWMISALTLLLFAAVLIPGHQAVIEQDSSLLPEVAIIAAICILLNFVLSVALARRVLGSILSLQEAVQKVTTGDLSARAATSDRDEIGQLGHAFNQMTEGLLQRDNILQSVRFAAEKFLTSSDWRRTIGEVLAHIGTAARASRLAILENDPPGRDEVTTSRSCAWSAPDLPLDTEIAPLQNVSWHRAGFGAQAEKLANGELITFTINDASPDALRYVGPHGTKSFMFAPILVGGSWWGVLALSDIRADRRWTPAEITSLRAVADMLGAAIGRQRTEDALRIAKEKAESANQAKSQFLANVSHEIRTPITGVMGMLQLLKRTEPDPRQARYVNQALDSADTLLAVIGDVLDFSKIEAGRFELVASDFSLHEVIESAVRLFAGRAEQKGIEVVARMDPKLPDEFCGDANRLRQILMNLLGNALKFTDRGEVVLTCRACNEGLQDSYVRFEVRDTGCGIAPEQQKFIFDAFTQADNSTTRAHGGTGLGLTISRQLCELMGGRIGVESTPGQGSTFWFTIKLDPPTSPQHDTLLRQPRDLAGLPVLIVDDSMVVRESVRELVAAWKGRPTDVGDATTAMAQLWAAAQRGQPFGVAILDWRMPSEDGLALAARIKADPRLARTGLVLITSFAPTLNEATLANFAAAVSKPVRWSELYEAITNAAKGQRSFGAGPALPPPALVPPLPSDSDESEVLLAEDNEINREVVTGLLTHLGHRWRCVANGREAIEAVKAGQARLVLMDCQMPEVDGYRAARLIREWEGHQVGRRAVPIIALTAQAMSGDRERCLAAGMNDYLPKPIDPELLATKLNRWLGLPVPAHLTLRRPLIQPLTPEVELPVVDRDLLLRRCLGRQDLADRLILKLIDQGREDTLEIASGFARREVERINNAAHRLKGAAANVAAGPLRQVALLVETATRGGRFESIPDLIQRLELELERLAAAARQRQMEKELV